MTPPNVLLMLCRLFLKGVESLIMLAHQHLQSGQLFWSGLETVRLWNCKSGSRSVWHATCSFGMTVSSVIALQSWMWNICLAKKNGFQTKLLLGLAILGEAVNNRLWSNDSQQGPPDIEQTLLAGCSTAHHAGPSASASCWAHFEHPVTQTYKSHTMWLQHMNGIWHICHGVTDLSNKGSWKLLWLD